MGWKLKTLLIAVGVTILLVGTNLGQHFLIGKKREQALTHHYDQQIEALELQIASIGPMVSIWTIREGNVSVHAGQEIQWGDLEQRELPESLVTQSLVLDPTPLIGKYYRIGLKPGTPLTWDLILEDAIDDTVREYDISSNVLPIGLKVGDYIDFRIVYPFGEDYIVLSHKRVEAIHDKIVKVKLNETEIHTYQAALVDYFLRARHGSYLYMTKYVEPGVQSPAQHYYAIPENIIRIMEIDPNIVHRLNPVQHANERAFIDAMSEDMTNEAGSAISAGRNEVKSKIDQGQTDFENRQGDFEEDQNLLQNPLDLSAPPPVSAPPEGQNEPQTGPSAGGIPTILFEEGVVE